ncbi:MAG: ATP-dependent helicase [Chroococcales cyanobacterium]
MSFDSDSDFQLSANSNPLLKEREDLLHQIRNSLRPGQQSLADWQGGSMAVSAVPGAGKSYGMAVAAALAVARYRLHTRRQLVVVTFTRSAAATIKQKIRQRLQDLKLPLGGFMVHTLHGLALNIATRHPDLSGINLDTATVIAPNQGHRLIKAAIEQWIAVNPRRYATLLEGVQFDGEETERLRRQSVLRTEVLPNLANTVIKEAKSSGLTPQQLRELSEEANDEYGILAIASGLYEQYQKLMRSRDFIDYDDMILAALHVLENDAIRSMWQNQVFAVFEDEAQDSSPLQSKLLRILATDPDNPDLPPHLVRVGDPNQAINSTFTPADPLYFNSFCNLCKDQNNLATMDQAGRSSQVIIDAANFLLKWVNQSYSSGESSEVDHDGEFDPPLPPLNKGGSENQVATPFRLQDIHPVDADDPQIEANPNPVGRGLEIYRPNDIYHSVELIGDRILKLFQENPESNAAVLVRENRQGHFIAEELAYLPKNHNLRIYEVGEVERHSHIPEEVLKVLQFLDRPHSPNNLKAALEVLEKRQLIPAQDLNALATYPEQFLYPSPLDPPQKESVKQARRYCTKLLRSRLELPHHQLIPFVGMALQYSGSELATLQKLAERIAKETAIASSQPTMPVLKAAIAALGEIVTSERFEGVDESDDDAYTRKGQLTIITMHKAKGLDWDYVFIPFLHDDILPGKPWVPTAGKFLGDFTLQEVARVQIRTAVHQQYQDLLTGIETNLTLPNPIEAWEEAGQLKTAEEYRLLYVAMTRAKRLLWMAAELEGPFKWNTFVARQGTNLQRKQPSPVVPALMRQFPASVCEEKDSVWRG